MRRFISCKSIASGHNLIHFGINIASNPLLGPKMRTALVEQTDEAQVHALGQIQRALMQEADRPALFAKPNSITLPFWNRSNARLFDVVDFSPAVIQRDDVEHREIGHRVGKPVLLRLLTRIFSLI